MTQAIMNSLWRYVENLLDQLIFHAYKVRFKSALRRT